MFDRLTAESQGATQDPNGGAHPVADVAAYWWHEAVAQLCAVTYLYWHVERRKQTTRASDTCCTV